MQFPLVRAIWRCRSRMPLHSSESSLTAQSNFLQVIVKRHYKNPLVGETTTLRWSICEYWWTPTLSRKLWNACENELMCCTCSKLFNRQTSSRTSMMIRFIHLNEDLDEHVPQFALSKLSWSSVHELQRICFNACHMVVEIVGVD